MSTPTTPMICPLCGEVIGDDWQHDDWQHGEGKCVNAGDPWDTFNVPDVGDK